MKHDTRSAHRPPTRRTILKGAAAVTAALATPYLGRAHAAEPLYVNTWGGNWEKSARANLFDPFTKETGVEIRTVSPVSFAKLAAQVQTGTYEFDVTTLGGGDIMRANKAGLLAELKSPYEGGLFQNGAASHAFATVIAWNTEKYPNGGPQNWAEFWDAGRFPGSRSLQRYAVRIMPMALLADGVPKDQLYPLDFDRAFAKLDEIKPNLRVWWKAGSQSAQILRDGEIDAIGIWHGRFEQAKAAGAPVEMTWNQAEIDRAYWVVAKGSPNEAVGRDFVAFATSAKPLAGFCSQAKYGPLNPDAVQYVDKADLALMPTAPQNYPKTFEQDMENFGADPQEVTQRFEEWVAS